MNVNNPRPGAAGEGEGPRRLRAFPWRTREDLKILRALSPEAFREFDRFLHEQARLGQSIRAHEIPEAALRGQDAQVLSLSDLHAIRAARWAHGPGGGHARQHHPTLDDQEAA